MAKEKLTIKIAQVGAEVKEVVVDAGKTAKDALKEAKVDVKEEGITLRVSEAPFDLNSPLTEDCTIVVTPRVVAG